MESWSEIGKVSWLLQNVLGAKCCLESPLYRHFNGCNWRRLWENWRTVSRNGVKNTITSLPCVHWPQDLVKEGDQGASWELITDNRWLVMEMAMKRPPTIGIAWRRSLICLSGAQQPSALSYDRSLKMHEAGDCAVGKCSVVIHIERWLVIGPDSSAGSR